MLLVGCHGDLSPLGRRTDFHYNECEHDGPTVGAALLSKPPPSLAHEVTARGFGE